MTNALEIRVVGMSRSGNHAIINWILEQTRERYCFLNCAEPKTNPFQTARPITEGDAPFEANFSVNFPAERAGSLAAKHCLVHSYEDCFLGMVASGVFEERHDAWVGESARRVDLLILRDPFNLFASRRAAGLTNLSTHVAGRVWKQHAREFAEGPRYLNQELVPVSYNKWVSSTDYRRGLAHKLGFVFTDEGFSTVAPTHNGSSFDGLRFNGKATDMRVKERWMRYADDREYLGIFDAEMVRLAKEIFAEAPRAVDELAVE